jgi:peptidoglycan glycosyltransferase
VHLVGVHHDDGSVADNDRAGRHHDDEGGLMEKRIRRLGIFMMICFVALFIQLNNIQVLKANSLANNPSNPRVVAVELSQPRGDILSSDGVTLASSVSTTGNVYKYKRVYPQNTAPLFSQIVGFDSLNYGRTGVEEEYNNYLRSHTSSPVTSSLVSTLHNLLVDHTTTDNVTLTINSHLQLQVATIMDQVQTQDNAPVEGAVVINPKTGAIEAMYSNPTFDPTGLVSESSKVETATWKALNPQSDQSPLVSRTFQFGFIPGSTFKTVTTAAVYDHNPALAKMDYPSVSCITVPQRVTQLCNYQNGPTGSHESCGGTIQITLPQSCDTAFAQMGMTLGAQNLNAEAQAFGFNQNVPIDLPGAGVSEFPSAAALTGDAPLQATSAFGQGAGNQTVIATPLQMALVAAGLANQGTIMTPHVMAQIRDNQGNLVTAYTPKPWLTATNPLTSAAVTSLMQKVTGVPGSTAYGVFPASWNVAAKTGTAETGGGVLGNSLTNDWMIAFAPANDPKVAVAVVVPNQPFSATGAQVSGPPTKAIIGDALGLTP